MTETSKLVILNTTPYLGYSYQQVCEFFKSPDHENIERLDQRLNVPVYGRCGERRSPNIILIKFNLIYGS